MPIRFPTEAANADILGEDPDPATGPPEDMPKAVGADGTPRDRGDRDRTADRQPGSNEAKPGKDINAGGFVKDKDKDKDSDKP
jgi:hypothetical protein